MKQHIQIKLVLFLFATLSFSVLFYSPVLSSSDISNNCPTRFDTQGKIGLYELGSVFPLLIPVTLLTERYPRLEVPIILAYVVFIPLDSFGRVDAVCRGEANSYDPGVLGIDDFFINVFPGIISGSYWESKWLSALGIFDLNKIRIQTKSEIVESMAKAYERDPLVFLAALKNMFLAIIQSSNITNNYRPEYKQRLESYLKSSYQVIDALYAYEDLKKDRFF